MSTGRAGKPLGSKAYGHIPHLPGSRLGAGDHYCSDWQARIATEEARDEHDRVIVQEKLDGSCVAVARLDGEIVPLVRSGSLAISTSHEQHRLFHNWAWSHRDRFLAVLREGERLAGEWLAQAHGTRYRLAPPLEPFVAFDLMQGNERAAYGEFRDRLQLDHDPVFNVPKCLSAGPPLSIPAAMALLGPAAGGTYGHHGALDPVEGAVWRVERRGVVEFVCKYVRAEKEDGCYLPDESGRQPVWNWRPSAPAAGSSTSAPPVPTASAAMTRF